MSWKPMTASKVFVISLIYAEYYAVFGVYSSPTSGDLAFQRLAVHFTYFVHLGLIQSHDVYNRFPTQTHHLCT